MSQWNLGVWSGRVAQSAVSLASDSGLSHYAREASGSLWYASDNRSFSWDFPPSSPYAKTLISVLDCSSVITSIYQIVEAKFSTNWVNYNVKPICIRHRLRIEEIFKAKYRSSIWHNACSNTELKPELSQVLLASCCISHCVNSKIPGYVSPVR